MTDFWHDYGPLPQDEVRQPKKRSGVTVAGCRGVLPVSLCQSLSQSLRNALVDLSISLYISFEDETVSFRGCLFLTRSEAQYVAFALVVPLLESWVEL